MSAFSQLAAKAQVLSNHQVKINHFSSPLVKKKTKNKRHDTFPPFSSLIYDLTPCQPWTFTMLQQGTFHWFLLSVPLLKCHMLMWLLRAISGRPWVWVQCEYREWSVCWHYGAVMRCILHWKWEKWGRFWGCIAHLNFMTVMDPCQMLYI